VACGKVASRSLPGKSLMETMGGWDHEFRFLSEIGILDSHPIAMTPDMCHLSATSHADLCGAKEKRNGNN
jgi:hypothetical protein